MAGFGFAFLNVGFALKTLLKRCLVHPIRDDRFIKYPDCAIAKIAPSMPADAIFKPRD
jgi:hypothetical protein